MTPREKLQLSYELAFHPPRLNQIWGRLRGKSGTPTIERDVAEALDDACRLHLALPETGRCPQRALERLAVYQARSRAYGMPLFVKSVRRHLGRPELTEVTVQERLVRDIALPVFGRDRAVLRREQSCF
jgi:hypothetical protein